LQLEMLEIFFAVRCLTLTSR